MATQTLTVDGDGTTTSGWAAEGGTYTRLQSDDGDTTRLYTPNNNDVRQVTLTNTVGLSGSTINSLTVYAKLRSLAAYSATFQIGIRSAGTDYWSTNKTHSTTSYVLFSEVWTTDPATGAAWTVAALDAVQAGLKKTDANGSAVTFMYGDVDSTPGASSQIKSVDSVLLAGIKKIDGVAIASVKKVDGVSNV